MILSQPHHLDLFGVTTPDQLVARLPKLMTDADEMFGILFRNLSQTVAGVLDIAHGGTGQSATPTDGQLLIGKTSSHGFVLANLTAGANITITNGPGAITITGAIGQAQVLTRVIHGT